MRCSRASWLSRTPILFVIVVLPGVWAAACRAEGAPGPAVVRTSVPSGTPVVSDLIVYDDVYSRRTDEFRLGTSLSACFSITPGRPASALSLMLSRGTAPPKSRFDRPVVGRADPVPQHGSGPCYAIRLTATPLEPGTYTVWVLQGAVPLAQQPLHLRPSGLVSRDPGPDPTAAPEPTVSELGVCDGRVDCGGDDLRRRQDRVVVCVKVQGSGDGRPFSLVVTNRPDPPPDAQHPSVVARTALLDISAPLPFRCHVAAVAAGPLPPGDYWLWALYGNAVLGRAAKFSTPP